MLYRIGLGVSGQGVLVQLRPIKRLCTWQSWMATWRHVQYDNHKFIQFFLSSKSAT